MRKLIDADRLQEKTRTIVKDYARLIKDEGLQPARIVLTICGVIGLIQNAPPVDAVEVVRCRDCMNWIPGYIADTDEMIPPKCGKYQQMVGHSSDDFCSLGERKDGEQA